MGPAVLVRPHGPLIRPPTRRSRRRRRLFASPGRPHPHAGGTVLSPSEDGADGSGELAAIPPRFRACLSPLSHSRNSIQNRVEGAQEEAQCRYGAGRPHGGATGGAAWVVCRPSALKYRGRLQGGSRFRLIWTCVWLVGQDFFFLSPSLVTNY